MEEIILIVLGLVVGSFLNVVIYRLPLKKSIVRPRSFCPGCGKTIAFYDNIPVISFLLLRGKCRHCGSRISFRYPLVELFTAFSFWLCYRHFGGLPLTAAASLVFVSLLIVLALIDLKHMILPDELTLGGGGLFLIFAFFNPTVGTVDALATAFGSALIFTGFYFFYLKVRKMEGLGFGDVKMMILLGAFLGVRKMVVALFIASVSGLLVGLVIIVLKKKNLKLALPFGTFLSLGAYVSLFWSEPILVFLQSIY
jgi:leader peptidase (prepilin peptidase)/N-methyltransferase